MSLFLSLLISGLILKSEPAPAPQDREININLWKRSLTVNEHGTVVKSFRIGVGKKDSPSPVGIYTIIDKRRNWFDGFGSRWMQLSVPWGTYGIHGTNKPYSIGGYVSHGCFRMHDKDVDELYELVRVGTKVTIDGPLSGHPEVTYRVLVKGSRGALVLKVQNFLKAAGYYKGRLNGRLGSETERAIHAFQEDRGLPVTDQIHYEDLMEMGIIE